MVDLGIAEETRIISLDSFNTVLTVEHMCTWKHRKLLLPIHTDNTVHIERRLTQLFQLFLLLL